MVQRLVVRVARRAKRALGQQAVAPQQHAYAHTKCPRTAQHTHAEHSTHSVAWRVTQQPAQCVCCMPHMHDIGCGQMRLLGDPRVHLASLTSPWHPTLLRSCHEVAPAIAQPTTHPALTHSTLTRHSPEVANRRKASRLHGSHRVRAVIEAINEVHVDTLSCSGTKAAWVELWQHETQQVVACTLCSVAVSSHSTWAASGHTYTQHCSSWMYAFTAWSCMVVLHNATYNPLSIRCCTRSPQRQLT